MLNSFKDGFEKAAFLYVNPEYYKSIVGSKTLMNIAEQRGMSKLDLTRKMVEHARPSEKTLVQNRERILHLKTLENRSRMYAPKGTQHPNSDSFPKGLPPVNFEKDYERELGKKLTGRDKANIVTNPLIGARKNLKNSTDALKKYQYYDVGKL